MKTTAMQAASAVFLAFAMLAGGNVRADEQFTIVGENCGIITGEDTFDGKNVFGYCGDDTTLVSVGVGCKNNITELFIYTGKYMLNSLRLRVALDGVETPAWDWSMSTNNEALSIRPAIPTIKEMLKHSRLEIRIIERDGDIHNANIDISRFDEVIAPVREICQW